MPRHPYEFYTKYLLAINPNDAVEQLSVDGCPWDDESLDDLITRMGVVPTITQPLTTTALTYATEQRIHGMVSNPDNTDLQHAIRIFRQHPIRQVLELLMVTNLRPEILCELFYEGTGVNITDRQFALYKHYFWNTTIMSRLDWYYFLHEVTTTSQGVRTIPKYPNAADIWAAMHIEPRLVLAKMGYERFATIDKGEALDKLFTLAFTKAQEEAAVGNTANFKSAASVALQAYEASKTSATDVGAVLDKLAGRVKMSAVRVNILPIESITQGIHSEVSSTSPVLLPDGGKHGQDGDDAP